ncbi:unnamed protein product [Debaryomyces fabryi]|nr:unnamed protein product [Debaryomyces fabryi]
MAVKNPGGSRSHGDFATSTPYYWQRGDSEVNCLAETTISLTVWKSNESIRRPGKVNRVSQYWRY